MKTLSLLGSTGSIGKNVLEVVRKFPDLYQVAGLAAGTNINLLAEQVVEFSPQLISVLNDEVAENLCKLLPKSLHSQVVSGVEGNKRVASLDQTDITVSAIVGAAGLLPTLAAISCGKDIGLANKETLVMAGRIVMDQVDKQKVNLLPVDSEHSAIFQALEGGRKEDVAKIILTASGGPFRNKKHSELQKVTKQQALNHPNWSMGQKISIDSATLMNKGLEVIEARWLFDMEPDSIDVVVHPQSIVHSLVEYQDGSVLAQLGIPDMKIPIAYALSYPERLPLKLKSLSLAQCATLEFHAPDYMSFPALGLAFDALAAGGCAPAVLNAANEVAVDFFLKEKIPFPAISEVVQYALTHVGKGDDTVLDDILAADKEARTLSLKYIKEKYVIA